MRVERGASQLLFGFLPMQTADLSGRVWRVSRWVDPIQLSIDQDALRSALLAAIAPWTASAKDDGLAEDLLRRTNVEVVSVNPDRGVQVEPFPQQWRCKSCNRVSRDGNARCRCGSTQKAQMHFVSYHSCGAVDEPWIPTCRQHREITVGLPGTTSLSEMRFSCPSCAFVSWGFIPRKCACGNEYMKVTVHRAAVVYTPQIAVVVNPPDPAAAARIRAAGGGARALEWVLDGMRAADPTTGAQTVAGLVEALVRNGLSRETARELAKQAAARGEVTEGAALPEIRWSAEVRDTADEQALSLASAIAGGRVRVEDMIAGTTPPLRTLYEAAYPSALQLTRVEAVELLPSFPVATLAFGYTRGDVRPGESRLVPFRERGRLRAYGAINRTEALLFRLDPVAVHTWLVDNGALATPRARDARAARISILENAVVPSAAEEQPQPAGGALLTLVHSFAHRVVRRLSAFAGIERDSLGEYLLPYHLAFVVYAASRGEFVLGGLQAVFETSLHRFLEDFVNGESRCPLDPGCRSGGGACMACLHLGEPSCRWFNRFLDRSALFGPGGFVR